MVYYCPITGRVDEGVAAIASCCSDQCQHVTAAGIARDLERELGSWMLGEIGYDGLCDAICGGWSPFKTLTKADQDRMFAAIEQEIYG